MMGALGTDFKLHPCAVCWERLDLSGSSEGPSPGEGPQPHQSNSSSRKFTFVNDGELTKEDPQVITSTFKTLVALKSADSFIHSIRMSIPHPLQIIPCVHTNTHLRQNRGKTARTPWLCIGNIPQHLFQESTAMNVQGHAVVEGTKKSCMDYKGQLRSKDYAERSNEWLFGKKEQRVEIEAWAKSTVISSLVNSL